MSKSFTDVLIESNGRQFGKTTKQVEILQSQLRDAVALLKTYREAMKKTRDYADDYADSFISRPIRDALSAEIPESIRELLKIGGE